MIGMFVASYILASDIDALIDRDQDICFGAETQTECVDNGVANCVWVTRNETIVKNDETPEVGVSWCEMKLPWEPKE